MFFVPARIQAFFFSSPMVRRWKAGRKSPSRCDPLCGQRERTTRLIVREQSCLLHDESSGAVVREQSSVRCGAVFLVLWCENSPVLDVLGILHAVWCENNPVFDVLEWWAGVQCPNPLTGMFFFGDLNHGCCSSLNSPSFSTRTKSVSSVRRQARQARQARSQVCVSSFERQFVPCISPSHSVHLVTDSNDQLSSSQNTHGTRGGHEFMRVCAWRWLCMLIHHVGAMEHRNSCNLHAAGVQGRTRALSTSTRLGVGRPAVEKLASPQQAPGSCMQRCGKAFCATRARRFSGVCCSCRDGQAFCKTRTCSFPRKRKSCRGVLLWWLVLHVLIILLCHLGQAEFSGTCWVGHSWRKQIGLGYGCSVVPSKERNLFSSLDAAGDWVKKGSYHTAWSVPCDSSCTCSYAYGQRPRYRATYWKAVLATASWCVEGCRTPDEALVC